MKQEPLDSGSEEFRTSRGESAMTDQLLAEIDALIERSSLGTEAARMLRERSDVEEVRPVIDRAASLSYDSFAIGIEILPYELVGVLINHRGQILGRRRLLLPEMDVRRVVGYVAKVARDLATTSLGADLPHPGVGIGVELGGPVDTKTGTVTFYANHPTDPATRGPQQPYRWLNEKLAELVGQETGCRIVLENDASAFAVHEQKFGVGREAADYAVILIRDGVGCSMVVDNKLSTAPLEFGHVIVNPDGRECECGQRGDIESQAGRRAIRAVVREETGIIADDWEAAVELAQGEGDQADKALEAFRKAGEATARGIATLVTLLGVPSVVIYAPEELAGPGGSSRVADTFQRAVHGYSQYTFPPKRQCDIEMRPLKLTDGAHGAALLALNRIFSIHHASAPLNRSTSDGRALPPSPRRESPSSQEGHRP